MKQIAYVTQVVKEAASEIPDSMSRSLSPLWHCRSTMHANSVSRRFLAQGAGQNDQISNCIPQSSCKCEPTSLKNSFVLFSLLFYSLYLSSTSIASKINIHISQYFQYSNLNVITGFKSRLCHSVALNKLCELQFLVYTIGNNNFHGLSVRINNPWEM